MCFSFKKIENKKTNDEIKKLFIDIDPDEDWDQEVFENINDIHVEIHKNGRWELYGKYIDKKNNNKIKGYGFFIYYNEKFKLYKSMKYLGEVINK